jgi:hypothetical protein
MFSLTRDEFQNRTEIPTSLLCPMWQDANRVISMRDLTNIIAVSDMPKKYLRALIDSIPLVGDPNIFPYRDKKIDLVRCDTQHIRIGQTFVQNDKCLNLLNSFSRLFWDFAGVRGFAKQTCKVILGQDKSGEHVIAHYLCSIIEHYAQDLALLDGVHRQYIAKGVGTNIETLFIRNVEVAFPARLHHWREIRQVDTKPVDKNDRYFDLRPELFRDLKAIGIDG